ncbi:TIGR04282 family arsenosugar biosynthesis glycosyltransferase [Marinobacter salinisoli]|uniref:TIGR04282 family arsenosugar biosynthesis glycosyltransferase n=1 Tax=Marinobacter salinisoli TaxID=2769486 RepID=A0ABX7MPQ0_9GAMM|nr:TIGR04282 family arsenosugar biosynthesis glycosyltransferase [Marinobacter salinisoli]QSP94305.1 TIGR04282 family arsenosugar biosynthesis glycosyltransferase [Marinobacter salinisoli]
MPENHPSSTLLMQFAKWPEQGRVKTRLMPALGPAGALDAHVRLTLTVLDNLYTTGYPVQFWWDRAPDPSCTDGEVIVRNLELTGLEQKVQQGANLGQRMFAALQVALKEHSRALIVGSDCPSVDPQYIREAVLKLSEADVALGPSEDGGYVLIGASRVVPGMLDGIDWGTPQVLAQTCARLKELGLRVHLLEPRWDVDEPEDWERFTRLPLSEV